MMNWKFYLCLVVAFSAFAVAQTDTVTVTLETYLITDSGARIAATTASPGDVVEYVLTATNVSPYTLPAGTVEITGPILEGVTYVSGSATEGQSFLLEYSPDGQTFSEEVVTEPAAVRWTLLEPMPRGLSMRISYRVTIGSSATAPSSNVGAVADVDAVIQGHCRAEWPDDKRMRDYCIEQQMEGLHEVARLAEYSGGILESAFNIIFDNCVAEWPSDYQMQAYCMQQQIKAHGQLGQGIFVPGADPSPQESAIIEQRCQSEWPGDFRMQAYCEEQQLEGLAFLKNPLSSVDGSSWRQALNSCRLEWRDDFRMQAYCVRQQLGL